jgi:hypothetical protein
MRRALTTSAGSQEGGQAIASESSSTSSSQKSEGTCAATSVIPVGYPSHCHMKRTCQSCLQREGCMIDQYGECGDIASTYAASMDFRTAFALDLVLPNATTTNATGLQATQSWYFRAQDATYCSATDAVCQQCIASRFWTSLLLPDSRYCVGKDGCVCIFDCEDTSNKSKVECFLETSTPLPSSATSIGANAAQLNSKLRTIGFALCCSLIGAFLCLYYNVQRYRQRLLREEEELRQQREARVALRLQERQQRAEERGVGFLTLSGWQSYRQSLINKETRQLAGGSDWELVLPTVASNQPSTGNNVPGDRAAS